MKIYEATEQAYKNGYEAGKKDALKKIPVTNADRIRAMSDEELCFAIFNNVECGCCPASEMCKEEKGACTDRIMKWLKHHTEVD